MKFPTLPAPTQAGVAKLIATMIEKGTAPASLILLMQFNPTGKGLVQHAAGIEDPAVLLQPLRDDPESWQWLKNIPAEKLTEFAQGFIDEAKRIAAANAPKEPKKK